MEPTERGPVYVSRTGTASRSIDADPQLRAVYDHRRDVRRSWRRLWARLVLLAVVLTAGVVAYRLSR